MYFLWLLILSKSHLFSKLHWNSSTHSKSFLRQYFHQLFEFCDIFLLQRNNKKIQQMMLAFFNFLPTFKRLFNNCIKWYWYQISSSWDMKKGQIKHSQPEKTLKSPALLGLNTHSNRKFISLLHFPQKSKRILY